jgi:dimethylaniline monooxygenase (N-oxide forming)
MKAGACNIDDKLGWFTATSWKLWWTDREFYNLLVKGIWSPHFYRLFDADRPGARKKWDGARDAIIQVNKDVQAGLEQRKLERARNTEAAKTN